MTRYMVHVRNVGTVLLTDNLSEARKTFEEYKELSASGYGRAAHEEVVLFDNDELLEEFEGSNDEL